MTQQHTTPFWRNTLHTLAVSAMLACTAGTTQAQTNAPAGATPSLRPGEPVTLNFSGADIEAVSRAIGAIRSEEHTSELQSQSNLVCRLLLEKKKNKKPEHNL